MARTSASIIGILIMTGCSTAIHPAVPTNPINIIAHRGASAYAPENTLTSFALAKEMGADWFELDCTLTADDEVIVIHDDKVDRTTNQKGVVSRMTLQQLKQLDAGSWKDPKFTGEQLPTLAEALALAKAKNIGVYIEIKNSHNDTALMNDILKRTNDAGPEPLTKTARKCVMERIENSGSRNYTLTRKVIALIKKAHMTKHVVIQSFSPICCAVTQSEAPHIRTELLAAKDDKNAERWPQFLRWAELLQPNGFNTNPESLTREMVDQFHARGCSVAVWTVDDETGFRHFAEWGVDSIITNKPDLCLKTLQQIGRH